MTYSERKTQIKALYEEFNKEKRLEFEFLGEGGHYSEKQKEYAFILIKESGIRATAKVLNVPRRTLQRWCQMYAVLVKRCPDWVYAWAERRNKRKRFWTLKGYA